MNAKTYQQLEAIETFRSPRCCRVFIFFLFHKRSMKCKEFQLVTEFVEDSSKIVEDLIEYEFH